MSAGQMNKDRSRKNLLTLAFVLGWVAFLWAITILRMT